VRGLGRALEQRVLHELTRRAATPGRHLRSVAAQYGESMLEYLRGVPGLERIDIAGSYRRRCETVGDLDFLVTARDASAVSDRFVSYPDAREILAHGGTRCTIVLHSGLHMDLRVLPPARHGAGLLYFTGSKSHNIALRRVAQNRGLKLSEYGLFRGKRSVAAETEEQIYTALDLAWIPPELRENRGEIEAARRGELPELIELSDVRGDLQCHTTASDGNDSLERMAEAAQERGYEFLAITDHSSHMGVTGRMSATAFRAQKRRIDKLNARMRKLRVLWGAEIDILEDGALDIDTRLLRDLDVAVVAVHSHFDLSAEQQTRRVVRALCQPHVDILAHPFGRTIGVRDPIAMDLAEVIRAASDHGVILEINGQPQRLDLDDVAARSAIQAGVLISLGSDAHSTTDLGFMSHAVDQARRAWAQPKNVVNTLRLPALLGKLHGAK
jgi:DNA polymerase (family 10)